MTCRYTEISPCWIIIILYAHRRWSLMWNMYPCVSSKMIDHLGCFVVGHGTFRNGTKVTSTVTWTCFDEIVRCAQMIFIVWLRRVEKNSNKIMMYENILISSRVKKNFASMWFFPFVYYQAFRILSRWIDFFRRNDWNPPPPREKSLKENRHLRFDWEVKCTLDACN